MNETNYPDTGIKPGKLKEIEENAEMTVLSNKETEDLFRIAFRNYNLLVSVVDAKASLLIRINAIVISIIYAFLINKGGRSTIVIWPAIILLFVAMITILLAILASRPQNNSFLENKELPNYQRFFFGSFDMVDSAFQITGWEDYYRQLIDLFSMPRENIYIEIYKESFNVRKVLAKKFYYLSKAYWVFLIGIFVSVVSFVFVVYSLNAK